jgi:hypothetical protein
MVEVFFSPFAPPFSDLFLIFLSLDQELSETEIPALIG